MKRCIALMLCLLMILLAFAGCSKGKEEKGEEDPGAYVRMYLTDPVYNFDPALAYGNESALRIVSLLYENLFVLNANGKVENSLATSYKIDKKENTMLITLREDAVWSDGTAVSANDVVYAWSRILDSSKSFDAAVLLYDVKNARACKEGDVPSIDDVGVQALNKSELQIEFEEDVDYDAFLRKLTSYALCPLRSDVVGRAAKEIDWAKSPSIMVTSGPFRLRTINYAPETAGLTLERNAYYHRDFMEDDLDKAVTPFRLIVDYSMTDDELLAAYEAGEIFYIGDIPLSLRSKYTLKDWEKVMKAEVSDALSTHAYIFNENAMISGEKLFANAKVRNALSLAIDRTAIAEAVVFAEAANGLVPNGVFNADRSSKTFRENDSEGLALSANIEAAKALLSEAGITASKYSFAISVAAYDDVHLAIAEMVKEAWCALGFNVTVNAVALKDNSDMAISTNQVIAGVKDDMFFENYAAGKYEVAAIDYTALSADPFTVLAPFATGYTGGASIKDDSTDFKVAVHNCGYDSEAYNAKIQAAYDEKDINARAALLHEAEDILMSEMPIMPIVFNKTAVLESKDLSKIEYSYYQVPIFTKMKLKNYKDYIPTEE